MIIEPILIYINRKQFFIKNGINKDNRLENLRLHCPNCGSQLPTHGKRNTAYLTEEEKLLKKVNSEKQNKNMCYICFQKKDII